jgi:hypothetical protein
MPYRAGAHVWILGTGSLRLPSDHIPPILRQDLQNCWLARQRVSYTVHDVQQTRIWDPPILRLYQVRNLKFRCSVIGTTNRVSYQATTVPVLLS